MCGKLSLRSLYPEIDIGNILVKKLTLLCNQLQLVPHFLTDKQTLKHPELYTALYSTLLNPFKLYLILKPTNHIITLIANLCRVGIQRNDIYKNTEI